MKYRVVIFRKEKEVISDDIWYGETKENVKYWVDLAIRDIKAKIENENFYYSIEKVVEEEVLVN